MHDVLRILENCKALMLGVASAGIFIVAVLSVVIGAFKRHDRHMATMVTRSAEIAHRAHRIATPYPDTTRVMPLIAWIPDPRPAITAHNAFLTERDRATGNRLTAVG